MSHSRTQDGNKILIWKEKSEDYVRLRYVLPNPELTDIVLSFSLKKTPFKESEKKLQPESSIQQRSRM